MTLPKSVLAGGRTGPTLCWRAAESHHQSVQNWSCHMAVSTVAAFDLSLMGPEHCPACGDVGTRKLVLPYSGHCMNLFL